MTTWLRRDGVELQAKAPNAPDKASSSTSLCMTDACLHGWMDMCSPAPSAMCGWDSRVTCGQRGRAGGG
eukprot:scaffold141_cov123-Isochrysis_galbana.AAC.12